MARFDTLTSRQRDAVAARARGFTAVATARMVRCSLRTLWRWEAMPAFAAAMNEERLAVWRKLEEDVMCNFLLALEVERQVLNGELPADSGQARGAEKLIHRLLEKLLVVESL